LAVIQKQEIDMKKTIFTFIIFSINLIAYAQNNCECSKVLKQLTIKVENEYPGFNLKTQDSISYESFKNHLIELSNSTSETNCFDILKKYTNYFKDGHLILREKKGNNESSEMKKNDTIIINIENFNNYLDKSKDSIEGIWTSGAYKVGVVKQDSNYVAFVISSINETWKQSQIKFKLHQNKDAIYYMGNHSQERDTYSVIKNSIIYFKNTKAAFIKKFPLPQLSSENISKELNELEGFYIKPISNKTLLIRISSFNYQYNERIEKLFESNKKILEKYDNLIIDVRGNDGGTDYGYRPILPYLYTNPVRHLGAEYLVTQTLVDGLTNWANNADKNKYADDIKNVRSDILRMEGKIGQFIPYNAESDFGFTEQDSIYLYPKNVIILIDKRSASSTEKLILVAKQSKKVKILGTPTYGAIDYVSVREFKLDCNNYTLHMPTVRMMRLPDYPLDNIGIQPDIYMDKYVKDWVKYAQDYMENK
jgi:hypothetical protein